MNTLQLSGAIIISCHLMFTLAEAIKNMTDSESLECRLQTVNYSNVIYVSSTVCVYSYSQLQASQSFFYLLNMCFRRNLSSSKFKSKFNLEFRLVVFGLGLGLWYRYVAFSSSSGSIVLRQNNFDKVKVKNVT